MTTTPTPRYGMLIDPPVGPFHPPDEIRAWLAELAEMDQEKPAVIDAIEQAKKDLKRSEAMPHWRDGSE